MLENIKDFVFLLNMIVIIIGWAILNWQNNKRETRKEVRAALNEIQQLIAKLEADAVRYHTEKRNIKDEILISSGANQLSKRIQLVLKPLGISRTDFINKFKGSLQNEDNFGGSHSPIDDDDKIILHIRHAAQELSMRLEEDFVYAQHGHELMR